MLSVALGVAGLGLFCGALTTVAGMGGGLALVLALSAAADPLTALAISAPALLVGNAHRVWMYRAAADRALLKRLAPAAAAGAAAGGLAATGLPPGLIQGLMVAAALAACARVLGLTRWRPGQRSLAPMGLVAGFVTATSGGGGALMGPYLLGRGLSGARLVATGAATFLGIHAARLIAYAAAGVVDGRAAALGLGLAAALAAGNRLGDRLRRRLGARERGLQLGVALAVVALSLAGV